MPGHPKRDIDIRDQIIKTAQKMFQKDGIRAVRMDDIAHKMSISKRTLYETFETKKDLLSEVLLKGMKEDHKKMEDFSKQCDNVMDILVYFFRLHAETYSTTNPDFFEDLKHYPDLLESLQANNKEREKGALAFFTRGVEEGYFIPQVNYQIFCSLGHDVVSNMRQDKRYRDCSLVDIFNSVVYVLLRGICTEKGIKRLDEFVQELANMKKRKS